MANMSYCRFENTLKDLYDCYESMDDDLEDDDPENDARRNLIQLCKDIVDKWGDGLERN